MESKQRFKIRCMNADEVGRVAELVRSLQKFQKMKQCPRLPSDQDLMNEIVHEFEGNLVPNNYGTYTVVAIDMSKLDESNKGYIVGYLIYTQSFSITNGRHFYINSFFILEEHRHHGLGRKFMEYLRLHVMSVGNKEVYVPVMNDNIVGKNFYSNFGAKLVNEEYQIMGMELND